MKSLVNSLHASAVFPRRVKRLSAWIAPMFPFGASVLDVGCGSGDVAAQIMEFRPDVSILGVDTVARENPCITTRLYDGHTLPFDDCFFDSVMLVDVLHHTVYPTLVLRESSRVARQSIIVKDHLADGFLALPTLRLMDWVGNSHFGIDLPYNYLRQAQWESLFQQLGLKTRDWMTRLNIYGFWAGLMFDRGLHFVARLEIGDRER